MDLFKYQITLSLIILFVFTNSFGQGISINKTGSASDASAILDVNDTAKGILIPRMTEAQKNGIPAPATGLLIYQTDGTSGFYYWNGAQWTTFSSGGGGGGGTGTANKITYDSVGTFYWDVPAGVSTVWVTMCGGGGGGGGGAWSGGNAGGGGGAHAYLSKQVTVVPLAQVTIIVGAAGAAGNTGQDSPCLPGTNGGNGGNSSFGSLTANGGTGGTGAPCGGNTGGGTAGGTAGSNGQAARCSGDVCCGGSGGSSMFGTGGTNFYAQGRQCSTGFGSGGAGGRGPYEPAGPGTQGFVIIEW